MALESIDPFLVQRFRRGEYECLEYARDLWQAATGEDIRDRLRELVDDGSRRKVARAHRRAFRRLAEPQSPCLVLMRRPRSAPHVGVFLRGRVAHLTERGPEYMLPAVAARGFTSVDYYQ